MSARHFKSSDYFGKPAKPYPEFPLFAHNNGCWAKKIRGRLHYFGVWADPDAALAKYLVEKDALHAGHLTTPTTPATLTVKELCNHFLNAKAAARDAGELASRSWQDYKDACVLIVSHLGASRLVTDLGPDAFAELRNKLAKRWGPVTLGSVINRIRVAFKHASDNGLINRPIIYGSSLKRPSRKTLRIDKARKGPNLFTAEEIRRILDAASLPVKTMIFLGINGGFGNTDCGTLPQSALDLDRGLIEFPRPKTGIPRRCPLWPETVQSLKESLARRPEPKKAEHAGVCLLDEVRPPVGQG